MSLAYAFKYAGQWLKRQLILYVAAGSAGLIVFLIVAAIRAAVLAPELPSTPAEPSPAQAPAAQPAGTDTPPMFERRRQEVPREEIIAQREPSKTLIGVEVVDSSLRPVGTVKDVVIVENRPSVVLTQRGEDFTLPLSSIQWTSRSAAGPAQTGSTEQTTGSRTASGQSGETIRTTTTRMEVEREPSATIGIIRGR